MNKRAALWMTVIVAILVMASLACSIGGEEPTPTPEPPTVQPTKPPVEDAPTKAPPPTATPEPVSMAVTSLQDVKSAIIQIEAQGSFVDPQVGLQLNAAGRGSGFIIDESGIAVTNNHVVTGAALLKVWIGGESEPRNARVLGASECSDLAVIDIEGDGYPYLEWLEGPVSVGLDVYAAGFPLGDPEFTLTRGIVSKEQADGETDWASVDAVIEHDATINPGNSGGPLVTAEGKVVGVNYASAAGVNQYFAIAREEALDVIARLQEGEDVTSIGVNGSAVYDGSISGIWVSSVKSGSPADIAGVQGGDIITMIEGLLLATDGTMADYCDILRSHSPDDVLSIEVLRYSSEEWLVGQLNGRELEQTFSFAQELGGEVEDSTGGETYSGYTVVTDDYNAIEVEIPTAWTDFNGGAWLRDDQVIGAAISASSNLDDFWNTWSTAGVWFSASEEYALYYDAASFLDSLEDYSGSCVYEGRFEYEDPAYTGLYDFYSDCGDVGSSFIYLAAFPPDNAFLIWVSIQVVTDADLDALDHILNSFFVVGELPSEDSSSGGGGGTPPTGSGDMGLIYIGDSVEGFLAEGQDHFWTLNATGGERISIVLTPQDSDADMALSVMAPDGTMVLEYFDEAFSGESEVVTDLALDYAGAYTIFVEEFWDIAAGYYLDVDWSLGSDEGDYELIEMGDVAYGEVWDASLPEGKYFHFWTFSGVAGDTVSIYVSPLSEGADLQLGLVDSNGEFIFEIDEMMSDEMEALISYQLPATDSYGILVAEYWETYVDYELALVLE
jgi:serine protease Do